jgi:NADH:ubiquinone oxidoreductase subunit E
MTSIDEIASRFPEGSSAALGPFLRAVQAELNWVPREAMELASDRFGVSFMRVYEQAAFTPGLSLEKRGELVMEVCQGLACREAGGEAILRALEGASGLRDGETSPDGRLTLCRQSCFGRCAIGPNLRFQGEFLANQSPESAQALLRRALEKPESC